MEYMTPISPTQCGIPDCDFNEIILFDGTCMSCLIFQKPSDSKRNCEAYCIGENTIINSSG